MRILINCLLLAVFPFLVTTDTLPEDGQPVPDTTYCNARFDFCVEYPEAVLPVARYSDNNDGIILFTEDEKVEVTIAGSLEVWDRSARALYEDFVAEKLLRTGGKLLDKTIEESYYQVVYTTGNRYYFQQLFHLGNKHVIYQITTPLEMADRIDWLKESIRISFNIA